MLHFCRAYGVHRHSSSGTEGKVNSQGLKSPSPYSSHLLAAVPNPQGKILGEDAQKVFQTSSAGNLKGGNWENASLTCLTGMFCHTEHHLFRRMAINSFGDPRWRAELTQEFGYFPVYLFYQGSVACAEVLHAPCNSLHRGPVLIAPESLQRCLWEENLDPDGQRRELFLQFSLPGRSAGTNLPELH